MPLPFNKPSKAARKANYTGPTFSDPEKVNHSERRTRDRLRHNIQQRGKPGVEAKITRDIGILYKKPIHEWDVEELARGRPRDAKGRFRGEPPPWLSPSIQIEAKRRLMADTFGDLVGMLEPAMKTILNLIESEEVDERGKPIVDSRTKLAAAQFIIENVLGKPKALIELSGEDTVKAAIASAIVMDDGESQDHFVLEGEYEETEEEDDDDDE